MMSTWKSQPAIYYHVNVPLRPVYTITINIMTINYISVHTSDIVPFFSKRVLVWR